MFDSYQVEINRAEKAVRHGINLSIAANANLTYIKRWPSCSDEDLAYARIALELYVRRIVREIGALTAVPGGLDLLAFTTGVGEHNGFVRVAVEPTNEEWLPACCTQKLMTTA